jgi:SAM-dependent methyltransferase
MKTLRNLGAVIEDTLREEFIRSSFRLYGKRGYLLDLGCGIKPFKEVYQHYAESSVGIDVAQTPHETQHVDVFYDGKKIPFPDSVFDYVLCTEVMEHVSEPDDFLKEIYRVLKPGGILIMTIPFLVPLHEEPYDFYRYTKYGLKHLLNSAGYQSQVIQPIGEYFGVLTSLCITIQLKCWNWLSKKLKISVIYNLWNPFIFIFVWLPQIMILFLYKRKLLKKIFSKLSYVPKGYGLTAMK